MSQQEMQFESTQRSEGSYESGYGALPHYSNDYEASPYNQKIAGPEDERTRENAHLREHMLNLRMGMAITSLVFWMVFFFVGIGIILSHPTSGLIQALVCIGLGVFTVLVVLANVLVNRKRV